MEVPEYEDTVNLLANALDNNYGTIPSTRKSSHQMILIWDERERKRKETPKWRPRRYRWLLRGVPLSDKLFMFFGTVFAILSGILLSICALLFGGMTNLFISPARYGFISEELIENNVTGTPVALIFNSTIGNVTEDKDNIFFEKRYIIEEWFEMNDPLAIFWSNPILKPLTATGFRQILNKYLFMYFLTGTLMIIFTFLQAYFWRLVGERTARDLHKKHLAEILHRNVLWHDLNKNDDLHAKLADDAAKIREGVGEKCALLIQDISMFIAGVVIGLYVNLYLTLAILCVAPFMIGLNVFTNNFLKSCSAEGREMDGSALTSVAMETLTNMKAVMAFGTHDFHLQKYYNELKKLLQGRIQRIKLLAVLLGVALFIIYFAYAIGFAFGSYLIETGQTNPGSVFAIFFGVIAGTVKLSQSLPSWDSVCEAIHTILATIEFIKRRTVADPYTRIGRKVSRMAGRIEFKNISFAYSSRPDSRVLDDFNLEIEPGQQLAIVGSNSADRSAIVNLLLRFYNPIAGAVTIDDISIRAYDERWLRRQIGLVSREPVLFGGVSITENIMCGAEDVTLGAVLEVAKRVNAHDFIICLPRGYDTIVDHPNVQLSTGEKQRIAIARVLVRCPKILIMDDALSALDATSKRIVQETVETVMRGKTTVMLEQSLSAVEKADRIYVLQDGKLVEVGKDDKTVATPDSADESVPSAESASGEIGAENASESIVDSPPHDTPSASVSPESEDSKTSLESNDENPPQHSPDEGTVRTVKVKELLKLLRPEWPYLTLATVGFILSGLVQPLFAVCCGAMFHVFTLTGTAFAKASILWTCVFVVFSIFCGISHGIQVFGLSSTIEELVFRVASLSFENIVRKWRGWFNSNNNSSPRNLVEKLAHDPALEKVHLAADYTAGLQLSSTVTCFTAGAIGIYYTDDNTLLFLVLLIVVCLIKTLQLLRDKVRARNSARDDQIMGDIERIVSESVGNIRTVKALGYERHFIDCFSKQVDSLYRKGRKRVLGYAIFRGLASGLAFYVYAIAFGLGVHFLESGDMKVQDIYMVFFAFSVGFGVGGFNFVHKQHKSKDHHQPHLLNFPTLEGKLDVDFNSKHGIKPNITGTVEFRNVHFSYPEQPNVLAGVDFRVNAGNSLALFGESDCSKNTIIALLERFYDPDEGNILVDGFDIRAMNVSHLRSNIGLVTRDPMLFNASIKDNIEYGALSIWSEIPFDRVMKAAKIANIHEFIMSLPERYNTMIEKHGVQLSEDEKRRIAIARALLRDPKILLVDDVTAGLDSEGEEAVKVALDAAKDGRTCVIVSGCLLTVCNADAIYVIENGKLVNS